MAREIRTIEDVFDAVIEAGEPDAFLVALRERYFSALDYVNAYVPGPEIVFLESADPLVVAGYWTPQLIEAAGGRHPLNSPGAAPREIAPEQLVAAQPDRVILGPRGRDLDAARRALDRLAATRWWRALPAVAEGQVALVDGSRAFSQPGPGLVDAACWLVGWINDRPELIPAGFPAELAAAPEGP